VLAPAALATALVATAAVGVIAGRPVAALPTANQAAIEARTVVAGKAPLAKTAKTPGWRVVATIGPDNQAVTGSVSAGSAKDAWSVWTGTAFTAVERLQGTHWSRVPLPATLTAYARSAVAFGGDSPTDFWLFDAHRPDQALRYCGAKWTLQAIPSWVLQRQPGGTGRSAAITAVFGPDNVWVFSLDAGPYAARYNGRGWSKVRLPAAPDQLSAVSPDDIWALHGNLAWSWNGRTWASHPIPKVPADLIDSVTPDGSGGLWATGVDLNPGGFNLFYHLVDGRWHEVNPPAGIWDQQPETLTWIPGTRSVWGTAAGLTSKGSYGVIIKYGP
jgi:hypothetical protein